MKKGIKQKVFEKYNGLCAYTGKPLSDDWEVDHIIPKSSYIWYQGEEFKHAFGITCKSVDDIENLLPTIKIINHYKRALDLVGFRRYMNNFHKRIGKLPKNPIVTRSKKRKEHMLKIAELFDITPEKPFTGKFHFEVVGDNNQNETFYCADWDRCGAICDEQCPACGKAEDMPQILPQYLVRPNDFSIFDLDESNGCYRGWSRNPTTYSDGTRPNAMEHFTLENLTKNYGFFPICENDLQAYEHKHDEHYKFISWRTRSDGHGGCKGGTEACQCG